MRLGKKSVFWAGGDTAGSIIITMITMVLMARMITPADFGTGALVIGGVGLINLFVEGLFHDALIQNHDTDDEIFAAAFSLLLLISFGAVAATLAAGVAASIAFGADAHPTHIVWLFVVTSCSLPFSGALGIGNARMRRDMIFQEVGMASLIGRVGGSVVGLGLAFIGLGVWGLIAQCVSVAVLQAVLLYWYGGWFPRLRGSFAVLWPVCRFAFPYAIMNFVLAFRTQAFLMMLAAFQGLDACGYMNVAFRITTTPQVSFWAVFVHLGLPLLSRNQHAVSRMVASFQELSTLVAATTVPTFVGLALTANDVIPTFFGPEWVPAVPLVQLLAVGAAIGFLRLVSSTTLRALGYVRYSFASALFATAFTLGAMYIVRTQDLRIVALLWVLPVAVQLPVAFLLVNRVARISLRVAFGGAVSAVVATIAMTAVVMTAAYGLETATPAYRLCVEVVAGAVTATGVLLMTDVRSRTVVTGVLQRKRT